MSEPIKSIHGTLEGMGYNPFGVNGVDDENKNKLAQANGISVEQAGNILKEAEEKAKENAQITNEISNMLDMLNSQDEEEEIEIVDDFDFDNFLNENSAEDFMQNIIEQNQFTLNQQDDQQNNQQNENQPDLKNKNPFLNSMWN